MASKQKNVNMYRLYKNNIKLQNQMYIFTIILKYGKKYGKKYGNQMYINTIHTVLTNLLFI